MIIAIIGATGLVGSEIIKVLKEKPNKNIKKILLVASKKNIGKKIKNTNKKLISIEDAIKEKPKCVLFSAGSEVAKKYAEKFTKSGSIVIDNSSAFRMDPKIKLIVPEINKQKITKKDKIIANPNCSTIQMVLALSPIHKKNKIKRIVVSTYQAVSGSGNDGIKQLKEEQNNKRVFKKIYKKQIFKNVIPHCDEFNKNNYTKEEEKIIKETNKILNSKIKITATAVRVPTIGGHAESVNIELEKRTTLKEIKKLLKNQKGIILQEGIKYKTPIEVKGSNNVYVSRLRKDHSIENGFNMWVVADPLRKGAATNATQILDYIINLHK